MFKCGLWFSGAEVGPENLPSSKLQSAGPGAFWVTRVETHSPVVKDEGSVLTTEAKRYRAPGLKIVWGALGHGVLSTAFSTPQGYAWAAGSLEERLLGLLLGVLGQRPLPDEKCLPFLSLVTLRGDYFTGHRTASAEAVTPTKCLPTPLHTTPALQWPLCH